ncbi:peptidoglycan/LPS O-acetylase OafA/YrhL [Desulfobaculum xiamenense]|uniref:Peptidoglycan/LPS O-acetylase OafA/YrhL n=1 Tax=Desulfobaculum xiamenense TaxID=995050 RepID=A0A846QHI6_9BACT|nr:acyltransferase [Desulfobaculum xiamenense]NJB68296.1 peptidoglycan/LPS O-acetylase OafA/YrhL [Desulfobaculum xiamenense]
MGLLRLLLALSVFEHHSGIAGYDFLKGSSAVQCFFILSGFYMALILNGRYATRPLGVFYANRFLRLMPAYLVTCLLSLVALALFDAHPFMDADYLASVGDWPLPERLALALSSLFVIGQDLLFVTGVDALGHFHFAAGDPAAVKAYTFSLVPQAWSLSVEMLFYLAAPFLVRGGVRRCSAILAAGLALRLSLYALGPAADAFAYRFMPAHLPLFMAGALAHHAYTLIKDRPWACRVGAWLLPFTIAGMLLHGVAPAPWRFPALAVLVASATPFIFALTRDSRTDRLLGDLSYPLYLVHFLCIALWEAAPCELSSAALVLGTAVATLGLYALVDRPIDRWRHRATQALPPAPPDIPLPPFGPEQTLVPAPLHTQTGTPGS